MMNLVLLALLYGTALVDVTLGRSNGSHEHVLRKVLLADYDKTVRPPPSSPNSHAIRINFGLQINRLVKVDNKEQVIIVDTWIVMKWDNSFFSWDAAKYGGKDRVHFLPTEIWFPDIALYNNADSSTPRAGGPTKFLSNVIVSSDGSSRWSGPATFTASCELALTYWPFDDQSCVLKFGSFSYDSKQLNITAFQTKSGRGGNYLESGNWNVESALKASVKETDFGNCCPYKFSEISYVINLNRRFQYHMFYLLGPCLTLAFLSLVSFWIPSESGERIGFVVTLLLGMMVFLLVVPDSLPVSSQSIPILGILMMGTMVMIIGVLLATIVVLRCFHATGKPPNCLRCCFKRRKNPQTTVAPVEPPETANQGSQVSQRGVRLGYKKALNDTISPENPVEEDEFTWQAISFKLDILFFWVSLVASVILYAVVLTYRG